MRTIIFLILVTLFAACGNADEPAVTAAEPTVTPPTFDDWSFGTDSTLRGIAPDFNLAEVIDTETATLQEEVTGPFETHLHFEQATDSTKLQIEYSFSDSTLYYRRLSFYPLGEQTPASLRSLLTKGLSERFGQPSGASNYQVWTFESNETEYEISLIEEVEGYDAPRYSVRFHRKNLSFY